jgi:hypothetical protein
VFFHGLKRLTHAAVYVYASDLASKCQKECYVHGFPLLFSPARYAADPF